MAKYEEELRRHNRERRKAVERMALPRLTCRRCGHTWIPRSDRMPTVCPKCKSAYWSRPRKDEGNVKSD